MKKTILSFCIALALVFSAFCHFYLNSQEVTSNELTATQLITTEVSPEEENSEVYFPDVAFVEKVSSLIANVFRVF